MRYLLLLILTLVLAACEPNDAVEVDVNVPEPVENAVGEVQEGIQEVGGALESVVEGVEGGGETEE